MPPAANGVLTVKKFPLRRLAPSFRINAKTVAFAEHSAGDNFNRAARRRLTVAGMHDDGFHAPAVRCERCGGDYLPVIIPTSRGPVMAEICPACDLGAGPLNPMPHCDPG